MCNGKCWGGCPFHKACKILLYIGGVNWGLVGLGMLMGSNWNVVNMLLGSWPTVEAIVYVLVGVATVSKIFAYKCARCMQACSPTMEGKM